MTTYQAQEIAKTLEEKWIARSRRIRELYGDRRVIGCPRADEIDACRRELQEAFGLVVMPESLDNCATPEDVKRYMDQEYKGEL